ncbi:MAG TPA: DNA replication protein DnaD [Firmicutes bacterium]|nr:DNA replication protein DnaD [Bacillota bacterium]
MYELWKNKCLDFNLILLQTYKQLGLNEQEYVFLVCLAHFINHQPASWTFSDISNLMTVNDADCSLLFISLVERKYIVLRSKTDQEGKRYEEYSLSPLFELIEKQMSQQKNEMNAGTREEIFSLLEQKIGMLSPLDIETVHMWMTEDGFHPELIKLAIFEMSANQIKSIRYIDKILLDWKRKNISTVDDAKRELLAFRQRKMGQGTLTASQEPVDTTFYYDWMSE